MKNIKKLSVLVIVLAGLMVPTVPIKKRKWMNGIFAKIDECSFPLSLQN
jgi:hypothetical protein